MNFDYVLDTYAWVEYFRGSPAGKRVKSLLESHALATPFLVIAELADFYEREKVTGFEKDLQFIEAKTTLLTFGKEVAIQAGKTKNEMRKKGRKQFGLADALILEIARSLQAKLVTGDTHFKGLEEIEFLNP